MRRATAMTVQRGSSWRTFAFFFIAASLGSVAPCARGQSDGGVPSEARDDVTRVFIFAGQSNMVGSDAFADRIDDFPLFVGSGAPQKGVAFSYLLGRGREASNGWIPLAPLRSFGPEVTFSLEIKRRAPFRIALIKSAVGGTKLATDWNPDVPDNGLGLYPRTLALVRQSLADLDKKAIRHRLEAVMWHQGENDMLTRGDDLRAYGQRLRRFIARLRKDLKAPRLKFFVGEVSEKGIWGMDHRPFLAALKVEQQRVVLRDPLTYWVPTSHLPFEVMKRGQPHYHFGTQGQLHHGVAYADAYLTSIGRAERSDDPPAIDDDLPPKGALVRLFIMAGQRNMEGEDAYVSKIPTVKGFESLARPQPRVVFRYSLGGGVKSSIDWRRLQPAGFLGTFGPELSLGAELRKSVPAVEGVAIVKFTHSGAQAPDWTSHGAAEPHRSLTPRFLAFVKDSIGDLQRRGYRVRVEGVFWHAGENDTYFAPYRGKYADYMKDLIKSVRGALKQPGLHWFVSEQHEKSIWTNIDAMNRTLHAIADEDAGVTIIPTSRLSHARLHFGAAGTLQLGREYAKAWSRHEKPGR